MNTTETTETKPPIDLKLLRKRIKDRERRFKKMTPAQKRVAIAKDVIAQLDAKVLVARSGIWVQEAVFPNKYREDLCNDFFIGGKRSRQDARDLYVSEGMPSCTTCALGAMFVCDVLRRDELSAQDVEASFGFISQRLQAYFDIEQLVLIEGAFERRSPDSFIRDNDTDEHVAAYEERRAASNFSRNLDANGDSVGWSGRRFASSDQRLRAIMENIVRNKGEFIP